MKGDADEVSDKKWIIINFAQTKSNKSLQMILFFRFKQMVDFVSLVIGSHFVETLFI